MEDVGNNQMEQEAAPVDQEMEIEEKEENPNGPKFSKSFTVLRLSVYNNYDKKVKININIKANDEAPNFHVPLGTIKAEIFNKKNKAIAYFHKLHPTKPFGEYTLECEEVVKEEAKQNQATTKNQNTASVETGDFDKARALAAIEGYEEFAGNYDKNKAMMGMEGCEEFAGIQSEIN